MIFLKCTKSLWYTGTPHKSLQVYIVPDGQRKRKHLRLQVFVDITGPRQTSPTLPKTYMKA